MHEYAVTQSMMHIVLDEAKRVNAAKVLEIRLVIGDLSTIIDDSVQMYFDIMSQGTVAQGARLVFNRVRAQFKCRECGEVFEKPSKGFDCPLCRGLGTPTGVGREFYIESLEIE